MSILYTTMVWVHLISMASLFGLLIACQTLFSEDGLVAKLSAHCRTFYFLLLVSGCILFYLKITIALDSAQGLNKGFYHLLLTKFFLLMGLGHFVFVGLKKNQKHWINLGLVFIAIAAFLGLMVRYL